MAIALMATIRVVRPGDYPFIRQINTQAFGQDNVADTVDALRAKGAVLLSLLALADERPVGHILYSSLSVGGVEGAGLGPLAVLPEYQRQGIGSQLVRIGNARLRRAGCPFIIVIGHAAYYPRFGFVPASSHGLTCRWEVPDETFMLLVLDEAKMRGVRGEISYKEVFCAVK